MDAFYFIEKIYKYIHEEMDGIAIAAKIWIFFYSSIVKNKNTEIGKKIN